MPHYFAGDYVLRFETGNLTDSDTHAQVYFRLHGTVGNASDIVNVNGGNFTIGGWVDSFCSHNGQFKHRIAM